MIVAAIRSGAGRAGAKRRRPCAQRRRRLRNRFASEAESEAPLVGCLYQATNHSDVKGAPLCPTSGPPLRSSAPRSSGWPGRSARCARTRRPSSGTAWSRPRSCCSSTWSSTASRCARARWPTWCAPTRPRSAGRRRPWSTRGSSSAVRTRTTAAPSSSSATDKGHALFAQMRDERDDLIASVLVDWQADDVRLLASLLDRFSTDLERHRPRMMKQTRFPGDRMTTDATASIESIDDGGLTHRQILTILVGLMMGMFLAALDQTIVATSIRTIADDLHGLSVQAWVTTAYLITSTITTPLYGKLSDIYGRKPLFISAISHLRRRLAALLVLHVDVPAGRVPRAAGHRRRRPVLDGAGDHRRHRPAARARQVPGLLPGGLRHLERARPGRRRLLRRPGHHPRHHRLALGLPGQRADRHRRAVRRGPHPAPAAPPAPAPDRLAGRRRPHRRPGAAADRGRAGPRAGAGTPPGRSPATSSA